MDADPGSAPDGSALRGGGAAYAAAAAAGLLAVLLVLALGPRLDRLRVPPPLAAAVLCAALAAVFAWRHDGRPWRWAVCVSIGFAAFLLVAFTGLARAGPVDWTPLLELGLIGLSSWLGAAGGARLGRRRTPRRAREAPDAG